MNWYIEAIKNYANFAGRARRVEFWMFVLVNLLIKIGFEVIMMLTVRGKPSIVGAVFSVVGVMYMLFILIPSISVTVRRLHDTDRSGWWILIPLIPLIFCCEDGQRGINEWGPNPKEESQRVPSRGPGR